MAYNKMVTVFSKRYEALNTEQRSAVDHIDGPLLVVAGPGTGKTELLGMRAANILEKTDTLPENILCLTFTDSGANAMRERLATIIGADAYKVAIHTFHSFGTEIINQNGEFFYRGADFKPADELASYEILTEIFDELDYTNVLAPKINGTYTYLADARRAISELKQAGLTSEELLTIIAANEQVLDSVEAELTQIFSGRISPTMLTLLAPLAERIAALASTALPPGVSPLSSTLALSIAHAFDEAVETGKTTPITAWRNQWMEKNSSGQFVFKDRRRHAKLRALSHVYFSYLTRMEQAGLYDYDDMILSVIQAMETHPDLKANLQEKFHYLMVDEFQDTNLAQLRILYDLTAGPETSGAPNIMAVGDDDQAIYGFQGADINNIRNFREHYPDTTIVTLTDNYRSAADILTHAREVVVQGNGRLEDTISNLSKILTAHHQPKSSKVRRLVFPSSTDERMALARKIRKQLDDGTPPESIAIIARKHSELLAILPYLYHEKILVNYEKRDNVLDSDVIKLIELLASIIISIGDNRHDIADSLLPELLAHPAFGVSAEELWRVSLSAYRNHLTWLEVMATMPVLVPLQEWLVRLGKDSLQAPLEHIIDELLGSEKKPEGEYRSPLYDYFFSAEKLAVTPDAYLTSLEALRTIRSHLRDYQPGEELKLADFLEFIQLHREMNSGLTSVHRASDRLSGAINLMTAHKSKGLEYDHVYIIGGVDSTWGERVRSRASLISYPENLRIAPSSNSYDERLRLFYVAMTRARSHLTISYPAMDETGRDMLPASFLTDTTLVPTPENPTDSIAELSQQAEIAWRDQVSSAPTESMKSLLSPTLETYKLSATHLNNFIDLSRGGPQHFLLTNLLKFPQAKSAHASYGTAIHAALQRAHTYFAQHGTQRPVEDILGDFTSELKAQHLPAEEFDTFARRGAEALTTFLDLMQGSFTKTQKTELGFNSQGVMVGEARLTGSLDLVDINDQTIIVTDYKTGKPSASWKGKSDAEKIKLHKYKQQLMFYQLLIENSRDFSRYDFEGGVLQFVEPDRDGVISQLDAKFTDEELERFSALIRGVWQCIMTLDFPDTSQYTPNYQGIVQFEQDIIDKYSHS